MMLRICPSIRHCTQALDGSYRWASSGSTKPPRRVANRDSRPKTWAGTTRTPPRLAQTDRVKRVSPTRSSASWASTGRAQPHHDADDIPAIPTEAKPPRPRLSPPAQTELEEDRAFVLQKEAEEAAEDKFDTTAVPDADQATDNDALKIITGKKRKKRGKIFRRIAERDAAKEEPEPLDEEAAMQESIRYADGMLRRIPKSWLQESSVLREAVGLPPTPIEGNTPQALESGAQHLLPEGTGDAMPEADAPSLVDPALPPGSAASGGGQDYFRGAMSDLYGRLAVLEENAMQIRQGSSAGMEATFKSAEAYLAVMERCPTGAEALMWLDELETLHPEWITPQHYEAALLLAVEPGTPVPERDILVVFLKARQRGMMTPAMYEHLFARLGTSSLREAAFPMLYQCLKDDYGGDLSLIPQNVCQGIFLHLKTANNTPQCVGLYVELSRGGCRVGISSLLEVVALLARGSFGSNDQDVLDFVVEELQHETELVMREQGIFGIPKGFFAKALAGCSPDAAVRLWHFMKDNGVRVTVEDYTNLMQVMVSSDRIYEAEEIMKYLSMHHSEYLWLNQVRIPKLMLRLYARNNVKYKLALPKEGNFPEQSNALYYFSEFFGPESGTPPNVSAYMLLIKSTDDEKLVHELWREMLSLGLPLETQHYNTIFRGMGGKIGALTHKIKFPLPASVLDEEIPGHLQREMATKEQHDLPEVQPPLATNTEVSYSPYDTTAPGRGEKNVLMPLNTNEGPVWAPSPEAYDNTTKPFHVLEARIDPGLRTVGGSMSEDTYLRHKIDNKRRDAQRQMHAYYNSKRQEEVTPQRHASTGDAEPDA